MQPLVSIIIPTYNRAHLIGETLDSVLAQTHQNWECIVVDDGSIDATDELLGGYCNKDNRFRYLIRKISPKGASHCRNIGLENVKGDYCIFLDSDDLLLPFSLEQRLRLISKNIDLDFYVFPMFRQNLNKELKIRIIPKETSHLSDFLSAKIHWGIMCTMWKTKFVKAIGGFNILFPRLNDPELNIRAMLISNNNYKIFHNAEPDSVHRWSIDMMNKELFIIKYAISLELLFDEIPILLQQNNKSKSVPLLKAYLVDYILESKSINSQRRIRELSWKAYQNGILDFFEFMKFIFFLK